MLSSQPTLIMDNGAYSIKAGYATDQSARVFPNTVFKSKGERKRIFVADELDQCTDRSALFFVLPFERGYLVNWDTQLQIWNRVFGTEGAGLGVDCQQCRLVLTDPNEVAFAFTDNTDEIVFENYRFHAFLRTSASACTAQAHCSAHNPCCVVVDSGHSFTHIVPFVGGQIVREGICKEDCCFVSTDFQRDMDRWRANRVDYVLPDFVHTTRGHVLHWGDVSNRLAHKNADVDEQQQKVTLGVERFALPELLIRPGDAEVQQMGIPEALCAAIERLPKEMQLLMARNIVLTGGNALFPGYRKRIEQELRSMLPEQFTLGVQQPSDPICHAWECARDAIQQQQQHDDSETLASSVADVGAATQFSPRLTAKFVSRSEYEENGPNICRRRFANVYSNRNVEDDDDGTQN
ncbi:hypothetical protein niasHS_008340 [Heterodera schachtii]|uniref:Actin-related protein 6 n=1 Tax=Heterodera schachtii TaxID=97005 RepID=A0ABD2J7A2_HETSC